MPPKSQIPTHTPTQFDTSNFAIVIPACAGMTREQVTNPALSYHPVPTTHENCIFAGPGIAPPLRRGELCSATETYQCPPPHTGPRANKVCVGGYLWGRGGRAKRDGGWGNTSNKSRVTSNQNGACAPFLYQFPHCNGCIAHAV